MMRRARTERGFDSLAEAQEAYDAMLKDVDAFDRPSYVLLVDTRLAPPRNDPGFEELIGRYYPRLYGGYPRIATLAKTQVGRLQIGRLAQRFTFDVRTFVDEAEAIAYLEEGGDLPGRSTPLPQSRSSKTPGRRGA